MAIQSRQNQLMCYPVKTASAVLRRIFANYTADDFAVRLWEGSIAIKPADGQPPRFTLVLNHPGALRRMFLPPSEINLGEAFIFGDFDIEGDIISATRLVDYFQREARLGVSDLVWLASKLIMLTPGDPGQTLRPGLRPGGRAHSQRRDRETVQFHYDVSNEFYGLWLDDWMNYSCAYFQTSDEDIHMAQRQKMDYICRKLRLQPGERLLDIGCGWGGLAIYAARNYGVEVTGITLSENQLALAQERVDEAGMADRVSLYLQDYRSLPDEGLYDKAVSVGMAEHVGAKNLPVYFAQAWRALKQGGLFLNHAIGAMTSHQAPRSLSRWLFRTNSFIDRYVFPDGELLDIHRTLAEAEAVGFEVRDVEALREHYALTLRHWVRRLEDRRDAALRHVDEATYRVWRLYMAGSARSFESGRINVYQTLLSKNQSDGQSGQPWTRASLYASQVGR